MDIFGECDITDRGGADDTPFIYALQRGHFCLFETDNYPDPVLPEEIKKAQGFGIYGAAALAKNNIGPQLMAFVNVEPFTTMFPEAGPNSNLFMRKIRKVFDPNSVAAPGRQVFTEEEVTGLLNSQISIPITINYKNIDFQVSYRYNLPRSLDPLYTYENSSQINVSLGYLINLAR